MQYTRLFANRHRGFTLIELMIVVGVMAVILIAVLQANFRMTALWSSERGRSQLQQNFRFAADHITTALRQAVNISSPDDNMMADVLTFDYVDTSSGIRYRCTYQRAGSGPYRIQRSRQQMALVVGVWQVTGSAVTDDVTETIDSLAAVHFVRNGPKVVCLLVARYDMLGSQQTITYATQTVLRNIGSGSVN